MRFLKPAAIPILIFLFFTSPFLSPASAQLQIGGRVPGFTTSTLDGKRTALKDYWEQQGKRVLVLTFSATWCYPCREDLPYLQRVQDQYGERGLQVLCVLTLDSSREDHIRDFMQKLGVQFPVLLDKQGIIAKRYAVTALPCNFVVDREGALLAKYLGYSEDVKRHFESELKRFFPSP